MALRDAEPCASVQGHVGRLNRKDGFTRGQASRERGKLACGISPARGGGQQEGFLSDGRQGGKRAGFSDGETTAGEGIFHRLAG